MSDYETLDRKVYLSLGVILGMAGGAVIGMLAAPRSGQESRERLRVRANEARDKARRQLAEQRDKAADRMQKAADKSADFADKAKDTARDVRAQAERERRQP